MRRPICLATAVAVAALALAAPTAALATPSIIGGKKASEAYPFTAAILKKDGRVNCGGSLVAPQWILTAAHCTAPGSATSVRLGSHLWRQGGEVRKVTGVIRQPGQNGWNDIALLRLDRPATQRPLPITGVSAPVGGATRVLGWGLTKDNPEAPPSPHLKELDNRIVADSECARPNEATPGEQILCGALMNGGEQACNVDSGGPLLTKQGGGWALAGLVKGPGKDPTGGNGIACHEVTAVFTDPTHFRQWIRKHAGV